MGQRQSTLPSVSASSPRPVSPILSHLCPTFKYPSALMPPAPSLLIQCGPNSAHRLTPFQACSLSSELPAPGNPTIIHPGIQDRKLKLSQIPPRCLLQSKVGPHVLSAPPAKCLLNLAHLLYPTPRFSLSWGLSPTSSPCL